jgi:hypothetical protein
MVEASPRRAKTTSTVLAFGAQTLNRVLPSA